MFDGDQIWSVFQSHHFKGGDDNPFISANLKRSCMLLAQYYSYKKHCNLTSFTLLESQFNSYCHLVDDREGINNFAGPTLDIASNVKNESSAWRSGLLTNGPTFEELSNWPSDKCPNLNERNECSQSVPTIHELSHLFQKDDNDFIYEEFCKDLPLGLPTQSNCSKESPAFARRNRVWQNVISSNGAFQTHQKQTHFHVSNSNNGLTKQSLRDTEEHKPSGIYFSRLGGRFKKWGLGGNKGIEEAEDEGCNSIKSELFRTAGQQLIIDNQQRFSINSQNQLGVYPKKSLGGKRRVGSKFVPPIKTNYQPGEISSQGISNYMEESGDKIDERLRNIDPKMVELIRSEIIDHGSKISWDDIAGLHFAKATIQEIVVWPMLRPDIFTGLRRPPKGILLFGPPGTGKTLIGKCIASQSKSTFFSISASSLTSKWIGDGEKMVRALFAVARVDQPAVVFIDEIDSLLSQRSDSEHESSRRIKTEFLVQLDGAGTGDEDRILVIGATNRPQELDEAARRRLVKRLYIPLPDFEARVQLIGNLMAKERNQLTDMDMKEVANLTEGYSGADIKNLCQEACLGPIRCIAPANMFNVSAEQVRAVGLEDFRSALKRVRSSVSPQDLEQYKKWDHTYGSGIGSL